MESLENSEELFRHLRFERGMGQVGGGLNWELRLEAVERDFASFKTFSSFGVTSDNFPYFQLIC